MKDLDTQDPKSGANQSGLRDQNARLVLSLIRRHGALPSADIARSSGLSAQTVSNIIRALETDGLLLRGAAVKGKVGKPSVPVTLNPQGVHALGLNIGRRASELVLVNFLGVEVARVSTTYPFPTTEGVFAFLTDGIDALFKAHPRTRSTITGIGIARPSRLWDWLEVVKAPEAAMADWRDVDIAQVAQARTGLDCFEENDGTSACVAEHLLGHGDTYGNFAYMFLGAFIGGGLVLNDKVVSGRTGNAASFGPMPVSDGHGGTTELLNLASLHVLERMLSEDGLDPMELRHNPTDWGFCAPQITDWIESCSAPLAVAAATISTVVEVDAILIDGAMPPEVCAKLTEATQRKFDNLDVTLVSCPVLEQGRVGRSARSLGAALLPIHARYFLA